MPTTQPQFNEFEEIPDGVCHKPTGAGFTAYKKYPSGYHPLGWHHVSRLGSILPDGRDYDVEAVHRMAHELWKRLGKLD